jgi:hypothetical protein
MFCLRGGESFGEGIGDHFFGGTVYEAQGPIFDNPADKVETYINVLGPSVVLMILG